MRAFFEDYKRLEKKEVRVEEFQNREIALKIVIESIERYRDKFERAQEKQS